MTDKKSFNINDYVEFILTERGANILNTFYEPYREYSSDLRARTIYKEGDTYRDQLWGVMQIFGGDSTVLGMEAFCKEATIHLSEKDLK